MTLTDEALKLCPQLIVINGEDLSRYKMFSKRISDLIHATLGPSERLGFDEHYIDITSRVEDRLSKLSIDDRIKLNFSGPVFPSHNDFKECNCGCEKKLMIGSQIAEEMRMKILKDLKLTCSIGIAHNKFLAKLCGGLNKPNNQTTLAPMATEKFMADMKDLRKITGVGEKTAQRIEELGIKTIEELQKCDSEKLKKKFGIDMANRLKELASGCDSSEVKPSGKPKTVGLEDSCRPISIRSDAQDKFKALLSRLMIQIQDDGRIPQSIKVTVRKYDPQKKSSVRETKQCALPTSHFRCLSGKIQFVIGAEEKIIRNVMILFDRMVDLSQQFNITLLGLCFSKFQDQKRGPGSIANFLIKKEDVEVQSITNLSNESDNFRSLSDSFRSKTASPSSSIISMDYETNSNTSHDFSGSEESEFEIGPSPKRRKKLNLLLAARSRRYSSNDEGASPSKLNVSALKLNGSGMDSSDGINFVVKANSTPNRILSPLCISNEPIACSSKSPELPPNVDPSVWGELPLEVQRDLLTNWKQKSNLAAATKSSKTSTNHPKAKGTLHKYFIRNS
jgi:DNA polymerase iota